MALVTGVQTCALPISCRYRHQNGQAVTLAWTGQWSEPDRQYFFIGRDITSQIEAERQAHDIQQLEAVNQLTGGLAHDFNNLLAEIGSASCRERVCQSV